MSNPQSDPRPDEKDELTTLTAPPALDERPALDDLLKDRGVPPLARTAVLAAVQAATEQGLTVDARPSAGHVSLFVSGQGVAVFVHPRRFSLTFDKAVAADLATRYVICELQPEANQKTGHVRISYDRLRDARWSGIVHDLLVEALERGAKRGAGSRRPARADAPAGLTVAKQCEVHQQAMYGGVCHLCD